MPLYEYECTVCHKRTEKIQKFSDPEITDCPFCGEKLERVLSAPAVSFKGGGWYADLYSSSKPKAAGASSDAAGSSTAAAAAPAAPAPATPAPAAPSTSSSSDKK